MAACLAAGSVRLAELIDFRGQPPEIASYVVAISGG